jgi:cytochrome P450
VLSYLVEEERMTGTCPVLPPLEALPFRDDRTAAWTMLRQAGDVAVSEEGVYFIIGADAVEVAAKNPAVFSSQGAFEVLGSPIPLVPIAFDPPEHSRYRRMLDKFFSPRSMAAREGQLRQLVGELIEDIAAAGGTCDVMSALAVPFPSVVFLTLFGLPLEDRERLLSWKDAIVRFADIDSPKPTPEVLQQAAEVFGYLSAYVSKRRGEEGSDLLSQLLADHDEDGMTDEEILGLCFIFILAGLDTVTAAVGWSLNALAQDPTLRNRVLTDKSATATFIEEVLRVDGPVPYVPRVTNQAVDIGGVTIPAGSTCWLVLGAADRDPRRYNDPDALHAHRSNHFAFGRGPHRCLGSHLARLELQLVIEEWHKRIPEYSLAAAPEVMWPSASLTLKRLDIAVG